MTRDEIVSALITYLSEEGKSAEADTLLFESGIIDSLDMLNMVDHVEETFGITLAQDDLSLDNFRTLGAVADLVIARR